jgi:signal transduction histidine kinase
MNAPLSLLTDYAVGLELKKSSDLIDDFIYSSSHGLLSPLKTMAGLVSLLKTCPPTESGTYEYLQLLHQSIHRLQHIQSQFEDLLENTMYESNISLIDPADLIQKSLSQFVEAIESNAIEVSIQTQQKSDFYSDQKRLNIVLVNLFSNAITFQNSNKKKKKLAIFVTISNWGCSIQVNDNGTGIAPCHFERIFELFFRGSLQSNGTGMGLYIIKSVLQSLNGTIAVNSIEGQGSHFSIWVPNNTNQIGQP